MEQHFGGAEELHDIRILRFSGAKRPNAAKRGEKIRLELQDKNGKSAEFEFLVIWREDYPNGYELDCQVLDARQRATIIVNFDHPEEDGVKLRRDVVLTLSR